MLSRADNSETETSIRTDLRAIFVSLELSRTTWLVTSLSPGTREKMSKGVVTLAKDRPFSVEFAPTSRALTS